MSANARRRPQPEAHQDERRVAVAPAREWDGHVRIDTDAGVVDIPGRWYLDLPGAGRPLLRDARAALPLPVHGDLEAWRDYLRQLVTLQLPGAQLRVRTADPNGWQSLEVAAPTTPPSVVHVDRAGLVALLGAGARITLSVQTD